MKGNVVIGVLVGFGGAWLGIWWAGIPGGVMFCVGIFAGALMQATGGKQ